MGAFGLAQAQQSFPDLAKGKSAVQRVFQIIKRESLIDGREDGQTLAIQVCVCVRACARMH